MVNLIFLSSVSLAQDNPSSYLGSGYREYLQDKIRDGYEVEIFTDLENRQREMVNKKNQIKEIVSTSYQANSDSGYEILEAGSQRTRNTRKINQAVKEGQDRIKDVASAQTEFTYVKYSDGKTVYFTDGMPTTIENERIVDEFGNVSIKNSWNMRYNDRRLLTDYEASLTDNIGNSTYIYAYGIEYSSDSVFYANENTVANKNEVQKYTKETDAAGNVKLTHWRALSYDGKLLRAFSQEIEDTLYGKSSFTRTNIAYEDGNYKRPGSYSQEGIGTDGLLYSLDRSNIAYNDDKDLVSDYHEEIVTTHVDGGTITTITDAQFTYLSVPHQFGTDIEEPDPDKLLQSIITTTTLNPDGSEKTETATMTYDYDADQELIGASTDSVFTGQEADWWQYSDKSGHILSGDTDDIGNTTYTYINPDTQETVIVPPEEIRATLEEGNKYIGTSKIQYEIFGGTPMTSEVDSYAYFYGHNISQDELLRTEASTTTYANKWINNLARLVSTQEHTEITNSNDTENTHQAISDITTTYLHASNGNLIDAKGIGQKSGWEYSDTRGWYGRYASTIDIDYKVILNKAARIMYHEDKDYQGGAE